MRVPVAVVALVAVLTACSSGAPERITHGKLSHQAVERVVNQRTGKDATCNHGQDMALKRGASYWCRLHQASPYRFVQVTITNPRTGGFALGK